MSKKTGGNGFRRVGDHRSTASEESFEKRLDELARMLEDPYIASGYQVTELIKEMCAGAGPLFSLHDQFMVMTAADMRSMLMARGTLRPPRGPKAKLADMLVDMMPKEADPYLFTAVAGGTKALSALRNLCDAGGVLRVPFAEARAIDDVVLPMFPVTALYLDEGKQEFVSVVPREILQMLATVSKDHWDWAFRCAQAYDEALHVLRRLLDLRGIVEMDEATAIYRETVAHPMDEADLALLLAPNPYTAGQVEVVNMEGQRYVASGDLLHDVESTVEGQNDFGFDDELFEQLGLGHLVESLGIDDEALGDLSFEAGVLAELSDLLDERRGIEPKSLTEEFLVGESVWVWTLRTKEARALVALLDEHVPDTADDEYFALDVVSGLVSKSQLWQDPRVVLDELARFDVIPTKEFEQQLIDLTNRLQAIIPCWSLNGWSRVEREAVQTRQGLRVVEGGASGDVRGGSAGLRLVGDAPGDSQGQAQNRGQDDLEEDLDDWEVAEKAREKDNERYIDEFWDWLEASGLKEKTIYKHADNVNFFLEFYLSHYEGLPMEEGPYNLGGFFGDFFIRKAMWSTPSTIRSTAASLKKFYKCMYEKGRVPKEALDELLFTIKDCLSEWCDLCAEYNDPNGANPFNPFDW